MKDYESIPDYPQKLSITTPVVSKILINIASNGLKEDVGLAITGTGKLGSRVSNFHSWLNQKPTGPTYKWRFSMISMTNTYVCMHGKYHWVFNAPRIILDCRDTILFGGIKSSGRSSRSSKTATTWSLGGKQTGVSTALYALLNYMHVTFVTSNHVTSNIYVAHLGTTNIDIPDGSFPK